MDATEAKLAEMLHENTGRHICDSGGFSGRHWQHNRGVDFEKEPEATMEVWLPERGGEVNLTVNLSVFHWLADRLEYNEHLDGLYRKFCEWEGECLYLGSAMEFAEFSNGRGIYGEGGPLTVNTCNGEDLLSQVIQYVYWTDKDEDAHILLQIHGGADVRGGYTYPVAFDLACYDGVSIFDNARSSISCGDCGQYWYTDNGYDWMPDGQYSYGNLRECEVATEPPSYPPRDCVGQKLLFGDGTLRLPTTGIVWVDEGGATHCPHCGGILSAYPWLVS